MSEKLKEIIRDHHEQKQIPIFTIFHEDKLRELLESYDFKSEIEKICTKHGFRKIDTPEEKCWDQTFSIGPKEIVSWDKVNVELP